MDSAQSPTVDPDAEPMQALADVYHEHLGFVWRVVTRMGVEAEAVADVVQDVFLVVHRRLADFDDAAPIRPWLAGICRGVVRNHRRSRARRRRRLHLLRSQPPPGARDEAARVEIGQIVAELLDRLDTPQRMAIVLTDIEGLSAADAARAMGVSRNTLYSRLRLAREKLRRHLTRLEASAQKGGDLASA